MRRIWLGRYRLFWPIASRDEYGRRTVAVPIIPGAVSVVVALWTCRCRACDEVRAETASWGL